MSNKIEKFDGEYRFLSNFYTSFITYNGHDFPTVEHAFQAAKCVETNDFYDIKMAFSPGEAKRLGRKALLKPNWDLMKYPIMFDICWEKFSRDPLMSRLLNTDDAELVEGNYWNDTYWGVCKGVGQNNLGKILMDIRKQLKLWQETTVV